MTKHIPSILLFCVLVFLIHTSIQAQDPINQPIGTTQLDTLPNTIAWSQDSNYFAVASAQGLKIYNRSLQEVTEIHAGQNVYSVDWHPSVPHLAITVDNTVEIWSWDASTSSVALLTTLPLAQEAVFTAWNADGTRLATMQLTPESDFQTGIGVGEISVWDSANYQLFTTVSSKYLVFTSTPFAHVLEWSPNNPILLGGVGNGVQVLPSGEIVSETDTIIYILDTDTGARIQEIPVGGAGFGYSIGWQPNGSYIAVGGQVGSGLFDISTGQRITTLVANHFDVFSLSWSPDGRYIASEQSVFDSQNFTRLGTFQSGDVTTVTWSPDGTQILISNSDRNLASQDPNLLPDYEPPPPCDVAIPCTVDSLTLVNADTGTDIGTLNDGDTIDLSTLTTSNLTIRANTVPGIVGNVIFDLNSILAVQTDDTSPYDLTNWTPTPGQYTLTATPYLEACGTAGTALTINFTIVDSGGPNQILFSSVTNPFTAATNIFVINPDGSGQTQLTTGTSIKNFPAWSPDGTQIAFASNQDGDDEIFVMNADGSNPVQLTTNTALDRFPVWSPDGTQIAFASRRDGNWEIYVMNADGTNPVNLTNNPTDDFNVSWSPDGTQIAFASLRDGTISTDTEIYVMNADGTNVQRLTNSPSIDETPNWSPDGSQIAFTSNRNASNIDIYVMNADGSNVQRLTSYSGTDEFPNWSPDGTQIAFDSNRSSFFNLYFDIHRMNADGTNVQRISTRSAFDRFAAWGYP
jgi:TolB protein